jgi:acyl carrier protein
MTGTGSMTGGLEAPMDRKDAMATIKSLIEDQNDITIADPRAVLDIDSFTIIVIITYAQEHLDITLDLEKLDFEDFESLARIEETLFSGRFLAPDLTAAASES